MVSLVRDVSLIITDTEAEALILEEQLIKTHLPRYNVNLKDDKSYPYCKLTLNELYPRLLVREKHDPKRSASVPFPRSKSPAGLRMVYRYFQLRTSKMDLNGKKPTVHALIFNSSAVWDPVEERFPWKIMTKRCSRFDCSCGEHHELLEQIKSRMKDASAKLEFEKPRCFGIRHEHWEESLKNRRFWMQKETIRMYSTFSASPTAQAFRFCSSETAGCWERIFLLRRMRAGYR